MAEDEVVGIGIEEGIPFLPSHVLHEAIVCQDDDLDSIKAKLPKTKCSAQNASQCCSKPRNPTPPRQQSKLSWSWNQNERMKLPTKCPSRGRGNGLQAIFLGSGQTSGGTGVFLPRGSNFSENPRPTHNKPAYSSVLLPARIVRSLELNNVHSSATHVRPRQEFDIIPDIEVRSSVSTKCNSRDSFCMEGNVSPEIYLPKEWTY